MRPRKWSYASVVIKPEPVPVLGQSGDSMPTSSTPACSRATLTKPPMYDRGSQASSASPLAGEPSWTKSSSVVSLGRNVTVSWTKFSTAMRIVSLNVPAPATRRRQGFAQVLFLRLPPLVQDGDVGADGAVPTEI